MARILDEIITERFVGKIQCRLVPVSALRLFHQHHSDPEQGFGSILTIRLITNELPVCIDGLPVFLLRMV